MINRVIALKDGGKLVVHMNAKRQATGMTRYYKDGKKRTVNESNVKRLAEQLNIGLAERED